jgi:hypothetical protein
MAAVMMAAMVRLVPMALSHGFQPSFIRPIGIRCSMTNTQAGPITNRISGLR